ncbi:MAG: 16S rRNA (cytidine(1402)-2'-O)-methyltransferase [Bifidobacteriaceae bacterium]|jgi:16S rRNA (cytidine1402-2'-O)-methyltransferase|nr:16S rRNA (cytidine(1402)-2'-O)-methyltransferase [Bifidobacteriaceae bacterium]
MGEGAGGRIVVAATPIGCDDDASPHLRHLLATADIVAAEDTRRVRALARRLAISLAGRVDSLHDANEPARAEALVEAARAGATVVLVSDAGTPLVSDPGFRVVRLAGETGVRVTCAPGPSAVLAALAVSGLATDRFTFEGFWPRKAGAGAALAADLATERRTMVFFASARRLAAALTGMAAAWGAERPAVVCRELTKVHEDIWRGTLGALADRARGTEVLGEITVVVAGAPRQDHDIAALAAEVRARADAGSRLADAAAHVASRAGMSRRALYEAALRHPTGHDQL